MKPHDRQASGFQGPDERCWRHVYALVEVSFDTDVGPMQGQVLCTVTFRLAGL